MKRNFYPLVAIFLLIGSSIAFSVETEVAETDQSQASRSRANVQHCAKSDCTHQSCESARSSQAGGPVIMRARDCSCCNKLSNDCICVGNCEQCEGNSLNVERESASTPQLSPIEIHVPKKLARANQISVKQSFLPAQPMVEVTSDDRSFDVEFQSFPEVDPSIVQSNRADRAEKLREFLLQRSQRTLGRPMRPVVVFFNQQERKLRDGATVNALASEILDEPHDPHLVRPATYVEDDSSACRNRAVKNGQYSAAIMTEACLHGCRVAQNGSCLDANCPSNHSGTSFANLNPTDATRHICTDAQCGKVSIWQVSM